MQRRSLSKEEAAGGLWIKTRHEIQMMIKCFFFYQLLFQMVSSLEYQLIRVAAAWLVLLECSQAQSSREVHSL